MTQRSDGTEPHRRASAHRRPCAHSSARIVRIPRRKSHMCGRATPSRATENWRWSGRSLHNRAAARCVAAMHARRPSRGSVRPLPNKLNDSLGIPGCTAACRSHVVDVLYSFGCSVLPGLFVNQGCTKSLFTLAAHRLYPPRRLDTIQARQLSCRAVTPAQHLASLSSDSASFLRIGHDDGQSEMRRYAAFAHWNAIGIDEMNQMIHAEPQSIFRLWLNG
jgi:hypothetical protein